MPNTENTTSRSWTPRTAPRATVAQEPTPAAPDSDDESDLFDRPLPTRVRPAPGAPGILVAHLSAAPTPYVYVGRQMRGIAASPLGNPFKGGQGLDAIAAFRDWLRDAYRAAAAGRASLAQQQAVAELRRLVTLYQETGALTLACWCAPDPCHSDEIARAIIGICDREPVELPGLGWAIWDRETAEEGLPWVVLGEDGKIKRYAASLAWARRPLAARPDADPLAHLNGAGLPDFGEEDAGLGAGSDWHIAPRKGEYLIPADGQAEQCRSCGAAIVWTRTAAGKPLPLSLATAQGRDGQRYALAHFADCPHGRDWSTK